MWAVPPHLQVLHIYVIEKIQAPLWFLNRYLLEGSKIMNPYLVASYAWAETRTLHVTFKEIRPKDDSLEEPLNLTGQLRVSIVELMRSLVTLKGHQRGKFVYHLLQSFFRTYILQSPRLSHLDFSSFNLTQKPYPPTTLHEIKTGILERDVSYKF